MFQKNILVKETHFPYILVEQKHGEPAKGCFGSFHFFRVLWDLNTRISQRLMEGDKQLEWVKGRGFWKIFQKSTSWGWEKSRRLSETKCCRFDVQVDHNILRLTFVNIWISYEKLSPCLKRQKYTLAYLYSSRWLGTQIIYVQIIYAQIIHVFVSVLGSVCMSVCHIKLTIS